MRDARTCDAGRAENGRGIECRRDAGSLVRSLVSGGQQFLAQNL